MNSRCFQSFDQVSAVDPKHLFFVLETSNQEISLELEDFQSCRDVFISHLGIMISIVVYVHDSRLEYDTSEALDELSLPDDSINQLLINHGFQDSFALEFFLDDPLLHEELSEGPLGDLSQVLRVKGGPPFVSHTHLFN